MARKRLWEWIRGFGRKEPKTLAPFPVPERDFLPGFEAKWKMFLGLPSEDWRQPIEEAVWGQREVMWILEWDGELQGILDQTFQALEETEARKVRLLVWKSYLIAFGNSFGTFGGFHHRILWGQADVGPDIIALCDAWLTNPSKQRQHADTSGYERSLGVPLQQTLLLEEMAHTLDRRLKTQRSKYASNQKRWRAIERNFPINLPNRKRKEDGYLEEELIAENWATAVIWYVLRPREWLDSPLQDLGSGVQSNQPTLHRGLKERDEERYRFVEQLFTEEIESKLREMGR